MESLPPMQARSWPTFYHCIYCAKEFLPEDLTFEHIVPKFLNGTWQIKAACRPCADHTNQYFESSASRTTFLAIRRYLKFSSRKKSMPEYPNAARGNHLKSNPELFNFSINTTRPNLFTLLDVAPAGWIRGLRVSQHTTFRIIFSNFDQVEYKIQSSVGAGKMDRRNRLVHTVRTYIENLDITLQEDHNLNAYLLTIVKIAYCYAVGILGINGFDGSDIRDLLSGKRKDIAYFVGSVLEDENLPENYLHDVHLRKRRGFLTAIVHLFASTNVPAHEVVLARWDGELIT